jgi:hypothetical protein
MVACFSAQHSHSLLSKRPNLNLKGPNKPVSLSYRVPRSKLFANYFSIFLNDSQISMDKFLFLFKTDKMWNSLFTIMSIYHFLSRETYWRGRLSTVDLLELASLFQLLVILKTLLTFFTKQVTLVRRPTVLSLPLHLVFSVLSMDKNLNNWLNEVWYQSKEY